MRLLQKIVEKIMSHFRSKDGNRRDMYLTEHVLSIGIVLLAVGVGFGVSLFFSLVTWRVIVATVLFILGVSAVLCWKNQSIKVISDEKFVYTTFLGNCHEYYFKDITMLRRNRDSMTLFVGKNKVHIESSAVMSKHLVDLINNALTTNGK